MPGSFSHSHNEQFGKNLDHRDRVHFESVTAVVLWVVLWTLVLLKWATPICAFLWR